MSLRIDGVIAMLSRDRRDLHAAEQTQNREPTPHSLVGVHHDRRRRAIGQLEGVAGRGRAAGVNRLKRSQAGKRRGAVPRHGPA